MSLSLWNLILEIFSSICRWGIAFLEALFNFNLMAGINPQSIRGTNTGVVVGFSHYPTTEGLMDEVQPDWTTHMSMIALRTMSNLKALLPNRISFVFDFKGPSLSTDTACSASGTAFTLAVNEMLLGEIKSFFELLKKLSNI